MKEWVWGAGEQPLFSWLWEFVDICGKGDHGKTGRKKLAVWSSRRSSLSLTVLWKRTGESVLFCFLAYQGPECGGIRWRGCVDTFEGTFSRRGCDSSTLGCLSKRSRAGGRGRNGCFSGKRSARGERLCLLFLLKLVDLQLQLMILYFWHPCRAAFFCSCFFPFLKKWEIRLAL